MKKFFVLFIISVFILPCTTSCSNYKKTSKNMIQSKRRFAEYIEPKSNQNPHAVDLSEGPKLNYDAKFGPKSLNFDIKIIDPYKY